MVALQAIATKKKTGLKLQPSTSAKPRIVCYHRDGNDICHLTWAYMTVC